jgi:RNA methyltransferase, TrmH family
MEIIRSASNPLVKRARAVGAGREEGFVLLEGDRLLDEAIRLGWELEVVLVSEKRSERAEELAESGVEFRGIEASLLERLSGLTSAPGVIGIAREPSPRTLDSLLIDEDTLLVVVGGVQDPGNLGALARTAEAAGAAAILVQEGGCRPWNGKALRGSMGSLLRLPVVPFADAADLAARLRGRGVRLVGASTRGGVSWRRFDWSSPIAIWLTAETGEMPDRPAGEDLAGAFEEVSIPMAPGVESLNVSAAAAILLFAAGRVPESEMGSEVEPGAEVKS